MEDAETAFADVTNAVAEVRSDARLGTAAAVLARGATLEAVDLLCSVVDEARAIARWDQVADALVLLARASDAADAERAARLLGAAERIRDRSGIGIAPADRPEHDALRERIARVMGDPAVERAWADGRAMSFEKVMRSARAVARSGSREIRHPK